MAFFRGVSQDEINKEILIYIVIVVFIYYFIYKKRENLVENLMFPVVRPEVRCPPRLSWHTFNTTCSNMTLKDKRDTVFKSEYDDIMDRTLEDRNNLDQRLYDRNSYYADERGNINLFKRALKIKNKSLGDATYAEYIDELNNKGIDTKSLTYLDYATFITEKNKFSKNKIVPKVLS